MSTHNIGFYEEIRKNYPLIIIKYTTYLFFWSAFGYIQPKKILRDLRFLIEKVEGLYFYHHSTIPLLSQSADLCSENKDADQLPGYRTADLRLCFHICKMQGFL